jgi:tetratricopeptide (TPR) repeat protein
VNPQDAQAHVLLGFDHLKQRRRNEAQHEFERAQQLDPNDAMALVGAARVGATDGLFKALRQLKELPPIHFAERARIGLVLGRFDDAASDAQKARDLGQPDGTLILAWTLLCQGKTAEANALFVSMPNAPLAHLGLAYVSSAQSDRQETLRHLTQFKRLTDQKSFFEAVESNVAFAWLRDDAEFMLLTKEK